MHMLDVIHTFTCTHTHLLPSPVKLCGDHQARSPEGKQTDTSKGHKKDFQSCCQKRHMHVKCCMCAWTCMVSPVILYLAVWFSKIKQKQKTTYLLWKITERSFFSPPRQRPWCKIPHAWTINNWNGCRVEVAAGSELPWEEWWRKSCDRSVAVHRLYTADDNFHVLALVHLSKDILVKVKIFGTFKDLRCTIPESRCTQTY